MAPCLGAQGVRLHQPDPRDLSADEGEAERRDRQRHRHGRREPSVRIHLRRGSKLRARGLHQGDGQRLARAWRARRRRASALHAHRSHHHADEGGAEGEVGRREPLRRAGRQRDRTRAGGRHGVLSSFAASRTALGRGAQHGQLDKWGQINFLKRVSLVQRVVAIGGGGFLMEDTSSPIDHYLLSLAKSDVPRVCFIPTPSGDLPEHLDKFYQAYSTPGCHPSHLSFFRKPSHGSVPLENFETHLLSQDIIFVGGGNTKSALAVWREWGLDIVLRKALEAGVVLSGMSAGAMCWFQQGLRSPLQQRPKAPLTSPLCDRGVSYWACDRDRRLCGCAVL